MPEERFEIVAEVAPLLHKYEKLPLSLGVAVIEPLLSPLHKGGVELKLIW